VPSGGERRPKNVGTGNNVERGPKSASRLGESIALGIQGPPHARGNEFVEVLMDDSCIAGLGNPAAEVSLRPSRDRGLAAQRPAGIGEAHEDAVYPGRVQRRGAAWFVLPWSRPICLGRGEAEWRFRGKGRRKTRSSALHQIADIRASRYLHRNRAVDLIGVL
jgi:hypothetical protein